MRLLHHATFALVALCLLRSALAGGEPARLALEPLPAARAGRVIDIPRPERGAVDRLREEETALALRLRAAGTPQRPASAATATPLRIDGINGKPMPQVSFTPGALYVVQGSGFGATPGQLRVTGQFPGGTLPVAIELWLDTMVVLRVPQAFGGVPDRVGVGVEVRAAGGASAAQTGARFIAARETITVARLPPSRIRWGHPAPQVSAAPGPAMRVTRHAEVEVVRDILGLAHEKGACLHAGADDYDFAGLPFGFVLAGYVWGFVQPPETEVAVPGSLTTMRTSIRGEFRADALPQGMRVNWAAVRYIEQPAGGLMKCVRSDSEYAISFRLEGPRGLNPFETLAANPATVQGGQ